MAGYGPHPMPAEPIGSVPRRIPGEHPFVLRASVVRIGLSWVAAYVVAVGLQMLLIDDYPVFAVAGIGVVAALLLVIDLATNAWRGPALTVGPEGIWVSVRVRRFLRIGQQYEAAFLPWASIERIYLRRIALDKRVCVRPRNPRRAEFHLHFEFFEVLQRLYGTPYNASLTFGDRPADEVVEAITRYGAGRTQIDL